MLGTIKHQSTGETVVVAKLLTGHTTIKEQIKDPDSYIKAVGIFDADFTAFVVTWQMAHKLTGDGIIGPKTWTEIAKSAPLCSAGINKISGATMALQILLDGNVTCDAVYGTRTKAAVATYQDAKKFTSTGICDNKMWRSLIIGDEESTAPVKSGKFVQPVDYKQADSRWGKNMYSNHGNKAQTMASSGCGPTACADVVATLKDKNVTPWTLAQLAMQWGDRTNSSGTSWDFFKHIAAKYQFVKFVQTKSIDALKACLDAGGYVVCSMGKGYWTKGGHYICCWKYDKTYVYCNDPASSKRKKQKITEFVKERKQYFCFYPDPEKTGTDDDVVSDPVEPTVPEQTLDLEEVYAAEHGEQIVDISKHDGDIDFDKLKPRVALVIARAGCGSDPDVKFDEYAQAMIDRNIPFGVYCYSYAATESKARDEAQKMVQRASKYNPLFYVMDAEESKITSKAIKVFADELRKLGVGRIGCYVAHNRYDDYDFDLSRYLWDFIWIPRYGKNDGTQGGSTKPAYKCDLWQYTSNGTIDGIKKRVDLNRVTGDGHTLAWFIGGNDK